MKLDHTSSVAILEETDITESGRQRFNIEGTMTKLVYCIQGNWKWRILIGKFRTNPQINNQLMPRYAHIFLILSLLFLQDWNKKTLLIFDNSFFNE